MGTSGASVNPKLETVVRVVTPRTWEQAREVLHRLQSRNIFRGHGNAVWPLATALERNIYGRPSCEMEQFFLRDFRSAAHLYASELPPTEDSLSWLALMQHHGVPTRLLDCTKSPFIAAFFAVADPAAQDVDYCIWAFDTNHIIRSALSRVGHEQTQVSAGEFESLAFSPTLAQILMSNEHRLVLPIRPAYGNSRLAHQLGLFLCSGNLRSSFEENLMASCPTQPDVWVQKIVLPAQTRAAALRDLFAMNIHPVTLFPGLDGYAQSLRIVASRSIKGEFDEWSILHDRVVKGLGLL